MIRRGQMSMGVLLTVLVFIIVLSASFLFLTAQGEKATDSIKDMNLPLPGTYCAGDAGDVPEEVFIKNIRMAAKVAWNGKKSCWVNQSVVDDDGNPITIPYSAIYDNITTALDGWGAQGDDCLGGYFGGTTAGGTSQIDMVFWWDDKAVCGTDGVITSTVSWVQGALGFSRDTLYFHSREDYCIGWALIDWYNPAGNSNIYKYSISKGRYNDDFVCRDESGSGGVDMKLPDVEDWTGKTVLEIQSALKTEIEDCADNYDTLFNGGLHGSSNNYMACSKRYKIKPEIDATISDIIKEDIIKKQQILDLSLDSVYYYTLDACDIIDESNHDRNHPDYSEFNSVTWNRDSENNHCAYIILNRLVLTEYDIMDNIPENEGNKLKEDVEYLITPFVYFESGGANDIVITIDTV